MRRTDECDKFYPIRLSITMGARWYADGGGVGGEAWTCDGQTNAINFIQFVCLSPWLLDGTRMAAVSAVKHGLATDRRMRKILSNSSVYHHGCSMSEFGMVSSSSRLSDASMVPPLATATDDDGNDIPHVFHSIKLYLVVLLLLTQHDGW